MILPHDAIRVFHAPYVEEINGILIENKTNFWSVWKYHSDLFIRTIFPLSSPGKNAVLIFSLSKREWDLWIDGAGKDTDPFEYPLDGLILYYLAAINGDLMIHASGINVSGHGYLFSGTSGKGKSTIAGLWQNSGARVIHDDRLVVRKRGTGYTMFNENKLAPVKGASAVSLVMANCIQHNWDPDIIAGLLDSVSDLCGTIPVFRLFFKPDRSVIDYILEYE